MTISDCTDAVLKDEMTVDSVHRGYQQQKGFKEDTATTMKDFKEDTATTKLPKQPSILDKDKDNRDRLEATVELVAACHFKD